MSETRSTRKRAKAQASAAAAGTPTASVEENEEATPAAAKPRAKPGKKAAAAAIAEPDEEATTTPSPPKKKRRKRMHKRKSSSVEGGEEPTPADQETENSPTTPTTMNTKKAVAVGGGASTPTKKARREPEEVTAATPEESAPVAKRTRKRKSRSGSMGGGAEGNEQAAGATEGDRHVTPASKKKAKVSTAEETDAAASEDRQVVIAVSKKMKKKKKGKAIPRVDKEATEVDVVERRHAAETSETKTAPAHMAETPKGRATRAALAAAAAAAEEEGKESAPTAAAPATLTTSKAKKKRKTKAARSASIGAETEPTVASDSKSAGPKVAVRKSARLAQEDPVETESLQLQPVKPVRKIISLAKVKGLVSKEGEDATNNPREESKADDDESEAGADASSIAVLRDTAVQDVAEEDRSSNPTSSIDAKQNVKQSVDMAMELEADMSLSERNGEEKALEVGHEVEDSTEVEGGLSLSELESKKKPLVAARQDVEADSSQIEVEVKEVLEAKQEVEVEMMMEMGLHSTQADVEKKEMPLEEKQINPSDVLMGSEPTEIDERQNVSAEATQGSEEERENELGPSETLPNQKQEDEALGDNAMVAVEVPIAEERQSTAEANDEDLSYQVGFPDEESQAGHTITSNDAEDTTVVGDQDVAQPDESATREDVSSDNEAASVSSINESEAFTLDGAQNEDDDDAEYQSLGVSSSQGIDEGDMTIDSGDESDASDRYNIDPTPRTASTSDMTRPHVSPLQADDSDEGSESYNEYLDGSFGRDDPHQGLNESFVGDDDESGDLTESEDEDNEDEFASGELPGLSSAASNNATAGSEVILLSDTDSEEEERPFESTDHAAPYHGGSENASNDEDSGVEEHEAAALDLLPQTSAESDRDIDKADDEQLLTTTAAQEIANGAGSTDTVYRDDDRGYPVDDETLTEHVPSSNDQDLDSDNRAYAEAMARELDISSHDGDSSANESDGTMELNGEDDEAQDDGDDNGNDTIESEERTGDAWHEDTQEEEEEQVDEGTQVDVQRTLFGTQQTSPVPAISEVQEDTVATDQIAPPATDSGSATENEQSNTQVRAELSAESALSQAQPISYTTTPSKHLIDSVLSASREETLAKITQEAMSTPMQPVKRSSESSWGPSFGVNAPLDTSSTQADTPFPAAASPLSSWFFSRGPANFKKRVLIPSPASPRQRVGSPRPLKMRRMESVETAWMSTEVNETQSSTELFVQDLVDKSAWRAWYSKTKPDQLLDPPLPVEMVKRLGGEAALKLLSHPCVQPSSSSGEPARDFVPLAKKRSRALAQLEASIQEEKTRTKAFDEELLQLLQGKTLSGRDLAEEFAPLLPQQR